MKKNHFLMRDVSGKPGASDAGGNEDLPAKLTRPRAAVAPLKETYQYRLVIVFHFERCHTYYVNLNPTSCHPIMDCILL